MTYSCRYRVPKRLFWTKLKNVVGDGIEPNFRFLVLEDDTTIYIPVESEVIFCPKRAKSIEKAMSKETGAQIQRN